MLKSLLLASALAFVFVGSACADAPTQPIDESKRLLNEYRKNPSKANYDALKRQAEISYDTSIAQRKVKLEELKLANPNDPSISGMQKVIDEMIRNKEKRVSQALERLTSKNLPQNRIEAKGGFVPLSAASNNVYIAYTPVTNAEYAKFLRDTGQKLPKGWANGEAPVGKEKYPVTNVSYFDAVAYCQWLGKRDGKAIYRLPTEAEWELAAGRTPSDAEMNCGTNVGFTPVDAYPKTVGASGAIDMWGNAWEWTSTVKMDEGKQNLAVKGGSWSSSKTDCQTEYRDEIREPNVIYDTVGFRVVKEVQ